VPGRVFQNLNPISTPGALGRGDDGVDLFGVRGTPDHQRICDRQNRRAMLLDQGFRLGETEQPTPGPTWRACTPSRPAKMGLRRAKQGSRPSGPATSRTQLPGRGRSVDKCETVPHLRSPFAGTELVKIGAIHLLGT
jgi:hypothetical protein